MKCWQWHGTILFCKLTRQVTVLWSAASSNTDHIENLLTTFHPYCNGHTQVCTTVETMYRIEYIYYREVWVRTVQVGGAVIAMYIYSTLYIIRTVAQTWWCQMLCGWNVAIKIFDVTRSGRSDTLQNATIFMILVSINSSSHYTSIRFSFISCLDRTITLQVATRI